MSKIGRFALYLAIIAIACSALGLGLLSTARGSEGRPTESQINTERSFAANGITALEILTISTDVQFHEASGPDVRVHFHGNYAGVPASRPELIAEVNGGTLRASISYPKHVTMFNWNWSGDTRLILDVYVPKKAWDRIQVHTTSGDCTIDDFETARFEFRSVSGSLTTNDVKATHIELHTTSGDVRTGKLSGDVSFRSVSGRLQASELSSGHSSIQTTSGDVELDKAQGGISFRSVSGDIRAAFALFDNDVTVNTTSGDLEFNLPANSQFNFEFRTTSGQLTCDFPVLSGNSRSRTQMTGTVGNGGKRIEAHSVSGDLRILKG